MGQFLWGNLLTCLSRSLCNGLLPPTNEVCEGYVFIGVCLSTGGVSASGPGGVSATHPRDQRQTLLLPSACWHPVNKRAVRIPLECILVHTAWNRNKTDTEKRDWHNRKQWVLVPVPVLDQCEHFQMALYFPFSTCTGPGPMQYEYTTTPQVHFKPLNKKLKRVAQDLDTRRLWKYRFCSQSVRIAYTVTLT